MSSGPDFMCIGMQKAGTGWLYDQLDSHPDFEMPPVKELHYFDRGLDAPGLKKVHTRLQKDVGKLNDWRKRQNKRPITDADAAFIEGALAVRDDAGDIEAYAALFEGHSRTGDITPAYSTLPAEKVAKVAERFPDLKVVLLLREPASRAVSHLAMMIEREFLQPQAATEVARAAGWFARDEVQDRSRPSVTWRRWAAAFPEDQIRYFFFEDLCERPDWLIAQIVEFLGGDPARTISLPPDYNRKGSRRIEVSPEVRSYFADALREETLACAELFGGHAKAWPARLPVEANAA